VISFLGGLLACGIHQKNETLHEKSHVTRHLPSLESTCLEEKESISYDSGDSYWEFSILVVCNEDSLIADGEIFGPRVLKFNKSKEGEKPVETFYAESALTPYGAHGFPLIDRDQYIYFEKDTLIIADHGGKLTYRWFLWHKFILDNKNWNYVKSDIEQFNPLADSVVYNRKTIVPDARVYLDNFEAKPVYEYLEK
jgi:hypothetical protein